MSLGLFRGQLALVRAGDDVEREMIWSLQYYIMAGTDGKTYYAKVRAVDWAGNVGQWSEPTDGITVDRTGPSGPDASDEGEWCTGLTTTFTWTASTDAVSGFSHYLVYVGTAPKEGDIVHDMVILGQSFTLTNLTEGTTYYCSVKEVDMVGNLGILGVNRVDNTQHR